MCSVFIILSLKWFCFLPVCWIVPWNKTECGSTGWTRMTWQNRFFTWKGGESPQRKVKKKRQKSEINNRLVGLHTVLSPLFLFPFIFCWVHCYWHLQDFSLSLLLVLIPTFLPDSFCSKGTFYSRSVLIVFLLHPAERRNPHPHPRNCIKSTVFNPQFFCCRLRVLSKIQKWFKVQGKIHMNYLENHHSSLYKSDSQPFIFKALLATFFFFFFF